jgi:hypothetical protein
MAMHREEFRARISVAIGSLLALMSAARGGTLTYGVDAGVAETDNVTLVPANKVTQTIGVTDLDFGYFQRSSRLDADAKGDFSYLDYLQGAYHNQVLGRFDGDATLALIQDRLTWALQEDYGQAALDPFTPVTPTNIESINYVSTGPDLHLRLGGLSFIDLGARAARADYETSPFSNNRFSANVGGGLELSALSSVSLNVDSQRVLFENTVLNTDFDRANLFVKYALQGARTELSAEGGVTRVSVNGISTDGGLATLSLTRTLSPAAKLSFTLGHLLTDGSTSFSGAQPGASGAVTTAAAATTSANYTSNYVSLGWNYQRVRTTLAVSARWERDTYAGEPLLDRSQKSAEFRVQRKLTRTFSAELTGRIYQGDYDHALVALGSGSPDTTTAAVTAGIAWHHGRGLEIRFRAEHTSYSVSSGNGAYRENRAFLTVGYRPFAAGASQESPGFSPGSGSIRGTTPSP